MFDLARRCGSIATTVFFFHIFSIIVIIAAAAAAVVRVLLLLSLLLYFGRTCSRHVIHSLMERNDTHYIPDGWSRSIVSSSSLGHSDT